MKRLSCFLLCVALLLTLCCCTPQSSASMPETEAVPASERVIGLWVSYSELNSMLSDNFNEQFKALLENCRATGISDLFVHVRAFCDSIYPSELFPLSSAAAGYNGDLLRDIVELTHKAGLRLHAWINPYRVRTADENIDALADKSPAKMWLKDSDPGNDLNVCFSNGIYLNPASEEVRRTVIAGIREILTNYDVDGIHFDDYFYPTEQAAFDEKSYAGYTSGTEHPLSLADWRRAQVNQLISGCYTAVKFFSKDKIFSVSPAASIEKNYSSMYADVKAWMKNGCVDWIIPQLYFGFEYPDKNFRFDSLLKEWRSVKSAENVRLIPGIAAYKLGTENEPDRAEWGDNAELIARQVKLCRECTYGAVFFSSGSLFSENELNRRALELIKEEIAK